MSNKKLVSAEKLLLSFRDDPEINGKTFARVRKHIREAPRVDAVEVVHGEWVVERSPIEVEFSCSECGYTYIDADSYAKAEYNYCPNCGAKMDGDGNV